MALTLQTEINGQQASSTNTYCYLYEPLRVIITESDSTATKLKIELEVVGTHDAATVVANEVDYAVYDLDNSGAVSIDLMKIVQQYHDANVYKFGAARSLVNISSALPTTSLDFLGWMSVVSRYRYTFKVTTDVTTSSLDITKLPILGGRTFQGFTPSVNKLISLTEADLYGVTLSNRWLNFPTYQYNLSGTTFNNMEPKGTFELSTSGCVPKGGMLVWKSRLGGWMYWGFEMKKETQMKKYSGNIPGGMFESDGPVGNPFVPVNYTSIDTSYKLQLKSLNLTKDELRSVASIMASPAVYYIADEAVGTDTIKMELMRVTSATAPLDSKANGGDFAVSLSSISESSQHVR